MTRLQGRSALVTGSTGGIGRAIAEALAREGATVVVTGRDAGRGTEITDRIRAKGGKAEFVHADLATGEDVRLLARDAVTAAGRIDILVNCAAYIPPGRSLLKTTEEQFTQALWLNVTAPALLTAALVPDMMDRGTGTVINIGSIGASIGSPVAALYGASKAALHSLTASCAAEFGPQGVRVNAVAPGPTHTETNTAAQSRLEALAADYPARRAAQAREIADAVVYLASDEASYIQGHVLAVDGGASTR